MPSPIISIIVPVYGTEKYLMRCVKSVLNQTFNDFELILVNDASPDNCSKILSQVKASDSRIKLIEHQKNLGLFLARISGADVAVGRYIAFLDSDDYVDVDFYRTLLCAAERSDADIAIGRTVIVHSDGSCWTNHLHEISLRFSNLEGDKLRDRFWRQEGRCYAWHTVWNKLYSRRLWAIARRHYDTITQHIVMTEDIAFSSVLFYFAKKAISLDNAYYFYCKNDGASTDTKKITITKFLKNVGDIAIVFKFLADFLQLQNANCKIIEKSNSFRSYYAGMWLHLAKKAFNGREKAKAISSINNIYPIADAKLVNEDCFFDSISNEWKDGLHEIKTKIISSDIKYISFDLFDTLICRPLLTPVHLFELLNEEFSEISGLNLSFSKIRTESEFQARRRFSHRQDISIDDIYAEMVELYDIDASVAEKMKKSEIALETKISAPRHTAKYLYDLANFFGKKIIIISDMYLLERDIIPILRKNSYSCFFKLYISSQVGLLKRTGALFEYVLDDLSVSGDKIIHIGDDEISDVSMPMRLGIQTFYFPKANKMLEDFCSPSKALDSNKLIDTSFTDASLGFGAMISIIANKYFDNPYRHFKKGTIFNNDPYFIGYYAVGMHLFAFCKWLIENGIYHGYKKLYFMARDGFLPLLAYDMISKYYDNAPDSDYLYVSRKAVLPLIIKHKIDLYDLPVSILSHTPLTLKGLLCFCMDTVTVADYKECLLHFYIDPEAKFKDRSEYNKFIRVFGECFYKADVHILNQQLCSEYFKNIEIGSATVDLGYSGRIQRALSFAAGKGIDVFFVHSDHSQYLKESRLGGFKVHCFYDYFPMVPTLVREYLFSDFGPSCTGFRVDDNQAVVPVFEDNPRYPSETFFIEEIHRGAIEFINDFLLSFSDRILSMPMKGSELSLPFEGFLQLTNEDDLKIFSFSFSEDDVWGAQTRINMEKFARNSRPKRSDSSHGRIMIRWLCKMKNELSKSINKDKYK